MCPRPALAVLAVVLCACAGPAPFVAPVASGKPPGDVSRLVAASEARLFPCSVLEVKSLGGGSGVELAGKKSEVTLLPGRYEVRLSCSSGYHEFKPAAEVVARAGKSYSLTGYLIDDSITVFNMKMNVKVAELP